MGRVLTKIKYLMVIFIFQICDEHLKIMNVFARYPGSTHDSFIWRNSNVEHTLRTLPENQMGAFYLLGKFL